MSTRAFTEGLTVQTADIARPRARAGSIARRWLPPLLVLLIVIALWSLLAITVYGNQNYLVPRPWNVAAAAWNNRGELWAATLVTLGEAAAGFGIAIAAGIAFAVLMSQSKVIERSLYPYAVLLQTVPIVAVAPIIVLWFGYSRRAVIVIVVLITVFPILISTLLGLLSTDRNHRDLFRLHHASRPREFLKLRLPAALPNLFAGIRVSAGLAVVGAIVGEFIIGSGGSQGGLGVNVILAQGRLDTNMLFADVGAATLLGFLFFLVATLVQTIFLKNWHESALRPDA